MYLVTCPVSGSIPQSQQSCLINNSIAGYMIFANKLKTTKRLCCLFDVPQHVQTPTTEYSASSNCNDGGADA